jgi:hypothetical protein
MTKKNIIELGVQVEDKVTGFSGIIIGRCEYLFGCTQYGICPRVGADGKRGDNEWIDEGRIKVVGPGVLQKDVVSTKPGADLRDDSPRNTDRR